MKFIHESIFSSAFRALCTALFAIVGLWLGTLLVIFITSGLFSSSQKETTTTYLVETLPDAEGKRAELNDHDPIILQINLKGVIGVDSLKGQVVADQLQESTEGSLKNGRVKGVLLIINTPGGTTFDSDEIYRALQEYKQRYHVPVYAYVDGLCASGGMYIACAADQIYASDVSLVGSVGVISQFFNLSDLLNKIGIQPLTVAQGKDKDNLNPFRPWHKDEEAQMTSLLHYYYMSFVDLVTAHRPKLNKEDLIQKYGAQVFPAPDAKAYGYIDASGKSRADALKALVAASGLPEGAAYQVVVLSKRRWFSELLGGSSSLFSGQMTHKMEWPAGIHPEFNNQLLYLYQP